MKAFKFFVIFILFSGLFNINLEGIKEWPVLKGPYLGQKPPGNTPELFAPGIVSTGYDELFGTFTPDGNEFYFILGGAPHWTILVMRQVNGVWTSPEVAAFSGKYGAKFCLSPDGKKVVLTSRRPISGNGEPDKIFHTWMVSITKNGWGYPKLISILDRALAPSMAANGNLYFFLGSQGNQDLYVAKFTEGGYTKPVNLGDSVNSKQDESDPFIAPDESYLIFGSNRKEGDGLYICYKKCDGTWTKAKNMGSQINSLSPNVGSVTPDGKYIFLFTNKRKYPSYSEETLSYLEKIKILNAPGNGSIDIYWVSAEIIEKLKPEELN